MSVATLQQQLIEFLRKAPSAYVAKCQECHGPLLLPAHDLPHVDVDHLRHAECRRER